MRGVHLFSYRHLRVCIWWRVLERAKGLGAFLRDPRMRHDLIQLHPLLGVWLEEQVNQVPAPHGDEFHLAIVGLGESSRDLLQQLLSSLRALARGAEGELAHKHGKHVHSPEREGGREGGREREKS